MSDLVSIDPGVKGGLVFWNEGNIIAMYKMPLQTEEVEIIRKTKKKTKKKKSNVDANINVSVVELIKLLKKHTPKRAILELPTARDGHSSRATMTTGMGWGIIYGILSTYCRVSLVYPITWGSALHKEVEGEDPKTKTLKFVQNTFPDAKIILPRCRIPHDGIVDAIAIGFWAQNQFAKEPQKNSEFLDLVI